MFCPHGSTYISTAAHETEEILKKLWELYDFPASFAVIQMKIYTLALFSVLQNLEAIPKSQACTFFTESQVNIAKKVENIITSDLRQHHPAWELAEYFSISETSLKNYFRGVYGQNISVYLREMRMNKAGENFFRRYILSSMIPILMSINSKIKFTGRYFLVTSPSTVIPERLAVYEQTTEIRQQESCIKRIAVDE